MPTPAHDESGSDQLALIGPRGGLLPRTAPRPAARTAADVEPVARVLLDSPLPRLDRPFDYLVPQGLHEQVRQGTRVRVRFGRRWIEAWVLGRAARPEHAGALQWVEAVVGPEPLFNAETLSLLRAVAEHYAGTLSDVLRLAIPPRHAAAAERTQGGAALAMPLPAEEVRESLQPGPGRWVWACPPGQDWAVWYAGTLAAAAAAGRTALAVVPDGRDVRRLAQQLGALLPAQTFAVLSAQSSAAQRYAAFLAALDGSARVVIGTRSAAFAPLARPDVLLLWDDGDDSHAERRAPYPHAREVLAMRSDDDTVFVAGGYARSTNTQRWLDIGWARILQPPGPAVRAVAPRAMATQDDRGPATPAERAGRLPPRAGSAIRAGLAEGPVLFSVGRSGYVSRLRCRTCQHPADCPECGGALFIGSDGTAPLCSRCGRPASDWRCPDCGDHQVRSGAIGSRRTAEELGRAFPNMPVLVSSGDRILDVVAADPALVIATPGAEPPAIGGYAAVVLLDVRAALAQPGLRSQEQAARRWFNAAALARPRAPLVVVADPALPVVQALLRWDPGWFAARELAQRRHAGMPPARKAVSVTARADDLELLRQSLPSTADILGPVPDGERQRVLLTTEHRTAAALLAQLRAFVVRRSAEGAPPILVRVDPPDLL